MARIRASVTRSGLVAGLAFGLTLALSMSATVSAEVIIKNTGTHGDFHIFDSSGFPGGVCGYSAADSGGFAYLRWIKLLGPSVQAADVTGGVDHQQVSFQVKVQRQIGAGAWKTVASSSKQTKTAYDNSWTNFTAMKVYANGSVNQQFRAISILRWIRNGSVDGLVKARMEYYGVKWTVGDPNYVYTDACDGRAD